MPMTPFRSFIWAGFECTYALAENRRRFDLLAASNHDEQCRADYARIREQGMRTVREGLSWHQIDAGNGQYDFSRFEPMMRIAREEGVQQVWDLNHFDFPDDVDPFSERFVERYAEYARRCLAVIRRYHDGTLFLIPMNEPSFFAWMCDNGLWAPYAKGQGTAFKKQLIRAAIAAMDAIISLDRDVLFIHADPYMHRQPLRVRNQAERTFCDNFNLHVKFHSWDMLSGRTDPELGGDPKYLNYLGINYYFYNQQFVGIRDNGSFTFRSISLTHKKRITLYGVLQEIYDRYHVPLIITETGSYRNRRAPWWSYLLSEVSLALERSVPLYGVCAYPTLDIMRGAGFIIPQSGLWDFDQTRKSYERIPYEPALALIRNWRPPQETRGEAEWPRLQVLASSSNR